MELLDTTTVRECVELIAQGKLSSEQLVTECLRQIDASDAELHAWQQVDHEHALAQARALDDSRRRGLPLGLLHGIPVGIKDIIDTDHLPTTRGSAIYKDRQADADAAVIEKLKEAGAVILGKTVTTEFAYMHPSATRNPHNGNFSPGGSSSGSAAAVAAGQVPLTIGTQTNGSVIRPASFCGVYGFKPSRGIVSRRGALQTSATLDQIGVFSRDVGDLALLADCLAGFDPSDCASYNSPKPAMLAGYLSEVPKDPALVWIDLPYADRFTPDTQGGCDRLLQALGPHIERVTAPGSFSALAACHKAIYDYEIYRCLQPEREQHWQLMSKTAQAAMDKAAAVSEADYLEALDIRSNARQWFDEFFQNYDAILTPAAVTEAPPYDSDDTGDPICCTFWTLCGLPCLTMPLLTGANNLPIGVQLIGAYQQDDQLLRSARWLLDQLAKKTG